MLSTSLNIWTLLGFGAVLTPLTPLTLFLLSLFVRRKRRREKKQYADRFQLRAHWETREMATYNLVVAKSGIKLKLHQDQNPSIDGQVRDPQAAGTRGLVRTIANPSSSGMTITVSGNALPIDIVVSTLQSYAGRPVFDKTGLSGMFDVRLVFFLEASGGTPQATLSDPVGALLATAIEEQLGLKLESAKGPVEVLVIDHVERPSEN